jgi:hypothetical protein
MRHLDNRSVARQKTCLPGSDVDDLPRFPSHETAYPTAAETKGFPSFVTGRDNLITVEPYIPMAEAMSFTEIFGNLPLAGNCHVPSLAFSKALRLCWARVARSCSVLHSTWPADAASKPKKSAARKT